MDKAKIILHVVINTYTVYFMVQLLRQLLVDQCTKNFVTHLLYLTGNGNVMCLSYLAGNEEGTDGVVRIYVTAQGSYPKLSIFFLPSGF